MILSCIVCGYEPKHAIDPAGEEEYDNHPSEATIFTSHGHYGSTFFDPMDSSYIEINVCDECLKKAQEKKQIIINTQKMGGYRSEVLGEDHDHG